MSQLSAGLCTPGLGHWSLGTSILQLAPNLLEICPSVVIPWHPLVTQVEVMSQEDAAFYSPHKMEMPCELLKCV